MRWALVLALLALGCRSAKLYQEVRPGLSCERATRVTHRTLVALGYTITELVPATMGHPGVVAGTKPAPEGGVMTGRVRITCDAEGAVLQPIEDSAFPNFNFSRGFGYSFKTLVQRPDVEEPRAAAGLEVLFRAVDPHEAVLDLGGVPTTGGAVPVRVTIRNNTDRAVAFDVSHIELVPAGGDSVTALSGAVRDAAIAPGAAGDRLRGELLRSGRLPARTTASGWLVYPAGRYTEARMGIEDVETGETEGFVAPVQ